MAVVQWKLVEPAPKREGKPMRTLRGYIRDQKATGNNAMPPDHAVFRYAEEVGLHRDFLAIAWFRFKDKYLEDLPDKKYKDWPRVFCTAVKENWMKVWMMDNNEFKLTTVGQQAQKAMQAKAARTQHSE